MTKRYDVDPNNKDPEDMVVDVDERANVYEVREVDVLNVEDVVFDVENLVLHTEDLVRLEDFPREVPDIEDEVLDVRA